jgi:hypothetical protein
MSSEPIETSAPISRPAAKTALAASARWLWWAPLLIAAAYLVTLALQFNQLLASTYLNADAASAPVIGELFGLGGHPQVLLGHLGWFSTLLFERGTRWLPLHRQIWEAAPYAMALVSAALVGWGAWRVAGRWAGAITVSIMVCVGPATLALLLALNDHAPSWFTLAALGAYVVLLEQRADTLAGAWLAVAAVAVGVLLGVNAASDVLLSIAGALPLLLAVGCTWALHPGRRTARAAAFALVSGGVAIVSGLLLRALMRHENVFAAKDAKTTLLVAGEAVGANFKFWWQSIAVLGNGNFFGQELGFSTALAFACAALSIAAVLLVVRSTRDEFTRALAARRRSSRERPLPEEAGALGEPGAMGRTGTTPDREASGQGASIHGAESPSEPSVRLAWCLFWGSSLVLLSAAFIFSGIPEGVESSRYLVGVIYAAAALVPLLGTRSTLSRAVVTAAVTLYAFTGWLALAQQRLIDSTPVSPSDGLAGTVAKIAREEHLSVGYGGYWDAAPITWATHLRVKVYPVDDCDGNQHLCGFELHIMSTWYSPAPAIRTFLLSDPAYPTEPSAPTPDLGAPIAVHQIGAVTMYVYPYNIASRLYAL